MSTITDDSDTSDVSDSKRANISTEGEKMATEVSEILRDQNGSSSTSEENKLDEGIQQETVAESRSRSTVAASSSIDIGSEETKMSSDGVLVDVSSENKMNSSITMDTSRERSDMELAQQPFVPSGNEATSSTTLLNPMCARFEPEQIQSRVEAIVNRWEGVAPMQPDVFLYKLLSSRGYDSSVIPAREYRVPPTEKQMNDYDVILVDAVRRSDMVALRRLREEGRCMNACNKHSESVLHMAARRSNYETVKFILENGGDLSIVDDYGRTPMHDACWRNGVSFDVITLLLNRDLDLLRTADVRGACPLSYVREEFWMHWCAYFFNQKEKYWNYTISEDGVNTPAAFDPTCVEPMPGIDDIATKTSSPAVVAVVPEDGAFLDLDAEEDASGARTRRRKAAVVAT